MKNSRIGHVGAAFVLIAWGATAYGQSLDVSYEMVWQGSSSSVLGGSIPVRVNLLNKGSDEKGVIRLTSELSSTTVPFEIPRGSEKSLVAYLPGGSYIGDLRLQVSAQKSNVSLRLPSQFVRGDRSFAVISDQLSDFSFGRTANQSNQPAWSDLYSRPGKAPDRATAYSGFRFVVLGEGAEKMTQGEVEAVQNYVIQGGQLIIFGGSNTPLLNDPRWQSFLPVSKVSTSRISVPDSLALSGMPPGSLSWITGVKTKGAVVSDSGISKGMMSVERGVGKVYVLPWNPTEKPMRDWEGKGQLVNKLFDGIASKRAAPSLIDDARNGFFNDQRRITPMMPASASSAPGTSVTSRPIETGESNPFSITPPRTELVFGLLFAYWLCLIPIHFGILKKVKKQNWAWISAPVIAIAFSFVFFSFAAGLYAAKRARTQIGTLAGHAGIPGGYLAGSQQLFFPKSGNVDLEMDRVESVWNTLNNDYGSRNIDRNSVVSQLVDVGEVEGNNVQVGNLSFGEMTLAQRVDLGGGILAELSTIDRNGSPVVRAKVTNKSRYQIEGAQISTGSFASGKSDLDPGETEVFEFSTGKTMLKNLKSLSIFLSGQVRGLDLGAKGGELTPTNDNILAQINLGKLGAGK